MRKCSICVLVLTAALMLAAYGAAVALPPPPGGTGTCVKVDDEWGHYTSVQSGSTKYCRVFWKADTTWDCPGGPHSGGSWDMTLGFSLHYNGSPLNPAKQYCATASTKENVYVSLTADSGEFAKSTNHNAIDDYHDPNNGDYHVREGDYPACHLTLPLATRDLHHATDYTPDGVVFVGADPHTKPGDSYPSWYVRYEWDQSLSTSYTYGIATYVYDYSTSGWVSLGWIKLWSSDSYGYVESAEGAVSFTGSSATAAYAYDQNDAHSGYCTSFKAILWKDPGGSSQNNISEATWHWNVGPL